MLLALGAAVALWTALLRADDPFPGLFDHEKVSLLHYARECEQMILEATGAFKVMSVDEVCFDRRGGEERYGVSMAIAFNVIGRGVAVDHHAYVFIKPIGKDSKAIRAYDVDMVARLPEIFLLPDKEFKDGIKEIVRK